ncbi:MAG: helix-turn-helix domain-containing protein [Azospirillum sp.]|nr:helix-turn-helix domain-containing protein [Azospirillum sp.]
MEMSDAIAALSALAQETRLAVYRLLIREAPNGLPAGEIASRLAVTGPTLSFHISRLERAGLVRSVRVHRQIIYAADLEGSRRLMSFLTEDCCQGRPEICGGLAAAVRTCETC